MSDKMPMTWADIIIGIISWCAGTEIINGMIAGFRLFFGGRHPEDWLHIQVGVGLSVLFGALFIWMRIQESTESRGDNAKAD
jgi:hypothetical protein